MMKSFFYLNSAGLVLTLPFAPERALHSQHPDLGAAPDPGAAGAAPRAAGSWPPAAAACPTLPPFGAPALVLSAAGRKRLHFLFPTWNCVCKVSWVSSSKQTCLPLLNTRGSIWNGEKGARISKPGRSKIQPMKELFFPLCKTPEQQQIIFF